MDVNQFSHPAGIFCDVGNLLFYVADKDNNRIKKLRLNGSLITSWGSLWVQQTGSFSSYRRSQNAWYRW